MTAEQFEALEKFAEINGKGWKDDLRDCWMTGNYRDYDASSLETELQQLRNSFDFGPSGLIKYKSPESKSMSQAIIHRLIIEKLSEEDKKVLDAVKLLADATKDEMVLAQTKSLILVPEINLDCLGFYVEFNVCDGLPGGRSECHTFYSLKEGMDFFNKVREFGWKEACGM